MKTLTHDYKRNGTTTLFAAIELAEGRIIAECMPRHRHQEWIKFLKRIDAETPAQLDLHPIVDNYATHKHPKVQSWLKRHPQFHIHFTPTSRSWLNVIERWFRDITQERIRNGVFRSVAEPEAAIRDYIEHHNANPSSFVRTKKAEDILEKVARALATFSRMPVTHTEDRHGTGAGVATAVPARARGDVQDLITSDCPPHILSFMLPD